MKIRFEPTKAPDPDLTWDQVEKVPGVYRTTDPSHEEVRIVVDQYTRAYVVKNEGSIFQINDSWKRGSWRFRRTGERVVIEPE